MLTYFIYCPLIFYTHLLLVVDRYRSQFIEYQENKHPQKIYARKKRGLIVYLTALKKGAIRNAHPYYATI